MEMRVVVAPAASPSEPSSWNRALRVRPRCRDCRAQWGVDPALGSGGPTQEPD